jgi:hypothetical protein
MRALTILCVVVVLVSSGCAMSWVDVKTTTESAAGLRVWLQDHSDENFRVGVTNRSDVPITVLVDSIKLVSPKSAISPERASPFMGIPNLVESIRQGHAFNLPPRQTASILLHYDLDEARIRRGDEVHIEFANAFLRHGEPMQVSPIEFYTE